jgi:hypothetical protein
MLWKRKPAEELPPGNDFDVVAAGMAVEDHYNCEPQEGVANPYCRQAARIAIAALRREGQLGPSIGTFISARWPNRTPYPWYFDVPQDNLAVVVIAEALRSAGDTWSEPHEEFARVAAAGLMRFQRIELPVEA